MEIAIPEQVSRIFRQGLEALNRSQVPYVIGGAFAAHYYTGIWRNTHDLDVYMERRYVSQAVNALSNVGFRDYGEMGAGDREWIYHAMKRNVLLDMIWQPPNGLSPIDESFYTRGRDGEFVGVPVRFMPPDELAWTKIFTLNRHRCDWPDVFNLVRAAPEGFDWMHLLQKMNDNWPLLLSFVVMYDWAYPGQASCVPAGVREELLRRKVQSPLPHDEPTRESILDPWIYTRPVVP